MAIVLAIVLVFTMVPVGKDNVAHAFSLSGDGTYMDDLQAVAYGANGIRLDWSNYSEWIDDGDIVGYEIWRAKKYNKNYKKIIRVNGNRTSYIDTKVYRNTKYFYQVRAVTRGYYNDIYSNVAYNYVGARKAVLTNKYDYNKHWIKINWKYQKEASGYEIYRYFLKGKKYKRIKVIKNGKTTSYVDRNLKSSTKYNYKVRAYRNIGARKVYGPMSNWKTYKTFSREIPNINFNMTDSRVSYNKRYVKVRINNNSAYGMTVLNSGVLYDSTYANFDRKLTVTGYYPISSNGFRGDFRRASSVYIPSHSSRTVCFQVIGNTTWYDKYTIVTFKFNMDGHRYFAKVGSDFGWQWIWKYKL